MKTLIWGLLAITLVSGCDRTAYNNPHKAKDSKANIFYSSFSEPPKTLDPAQSYSSDEIRFTAQIYEPLVQYDYFKRPYQLVPLTAATLPEVTYLDAQGTTVSASDVSKIAYSVYRITIQPGILYQPHPCFVKDVNGHYRYHHMGSKQLDKIYSISDFHDTATRPLVVDDYIYQIKRLAHPGVHSPIYGVMAGYIVGLENLHRRLVQAQKLGVTRLDMRKFTLDGVNKISDTEFTIKIKGKYPQFMYWLAMPFFAPVPWEADVFYAQPALIERNLTLSWYPVGTGPYQLIENNPNQQIVMARNPNFHGETFPEDGSAKDQLKGYTVDAGKSIPFVDKFIYSLEKESIPRWSKFLQGYYDNSAISSDSFDQAIQVDAQGKVDLTPELKAKNIQLQTVVSPSVFYLGFNMLDPVVGGASERARKLRQAISIAVDYREYISIFMNGRGLPAQGPIPAGIFGYSKAKNPILNQDLKTAAELMFEAGYPGGLDSTTGQQLVLHYDVTSSSGPDDKARFDWMRKQFAKLGIQLNIRSTQYNRFQEKMRTGNAQIFSWGWNADYPDPENFLFLLYGPNSKVKHGGENASNYSNPEFDRLFEQMKNMDNTPERLALIQQMVNIAQNDAPWVWGVNPKDFVLSQQWVRPTKSNAMANNTAKYMRINPTLRAALRHAWNRPVLWPLFALMVLVLLIIIPILISYQRRQRQPLKPQQEV